MKKGVIGAIALFVFLAFAATAFADKQVMDKWLNPESGFFVDNINYTFGYSFKAEKAVLSSPVNKLMLEKGECQTRGYHKFCFVNITEKVEQKDMQMRITITELSCMNYTNAFTKQNLCKTKYGYPCSSDMECVSGKCYHAICSAIYPICGDGYCDSKENCEQDCYRKAKNTSINSYIIPSNKDWVNVTELGKNVSYSFAVTGTYTINFSSSAITSKGTGAMDKQLECPDIAKGSLIMKLCGKCYAVGARIMLENNCTLFMKVNEIGLFDNKGDFTVKITKEENKTIVKSTEEMIKKIEEQKNQTASLNQNQSANKPVIPAKKKATFMSEIMGFVEDSLNMSWQTIVILLAVLAVIIVGVRIFSTGKSI